MFKKLSAYLQYLVPQHLLSISMGNLASSEHIGLKNWMIKRFIQRYQVDMSEAEYADADAYASFNSFFTRQLKSTARPIAPGENLVVSPADGTIAQIGQLHQNQLLQAKHFYYDLETLLANDTIATEFRNGSFATFYLAPHNYHRVHMPLTGVLKKTIFVPGKLFSVNRMSSEIIPNLFTRNERLISYFETSAGPMAVILIGAMIVGSIKMTWMTSPFRAKKITTEPIADLTFNKGDELGYFMLGSTVIILFPPGCVQWESTSLANKTIKYGEKIGELISN